MKTEPPLIGMPCRHDTSTVYNRERINAQSEAYLSALSQAGGIPFLIPLTLPPDALRRLYDLADGILLSGGGDIHPPLYHQDPQPTLSDVQPDRDQIEITISHWAAEERKPLLAICRGIQVLAVSSGGTLCQDIPSQMPEATLHHYRYNDLDEEAETRLVHEVQFSPESRLAQIFQTENLPVNSLHHQAVQRVNPPLQIVGCSSDGVVEAVELPGHPFYCGVQWHPEVLVEEHETSRQLFKAFIEACKNI